MHYVPKVCEYINTCKLDILECRHLMKSAALIASPYTCWKFWTFSLCFLPHCIFQTHLIVQNIQAATYALQNGRLHQKHNVLSVNGHFNQMMSSLKSTQGCDENTEQGWTVIFYEHFFHLQNIKIWKWTTSPWVWNILQCFRLLPASSQSKSVYPLFSS